MDALTSKWTFVLPLVFLVIVMYGQFFYQPSADVGGCSIGNIFCGVQLPPLFLLYLPGALAITLMGGEGSGNMNSDLHLNAILLNLVIYYLLNVLIVTIWKITSSDNKQYPS
jgi:hypothetical protein